MVLRSFEINIRRLQIEYRCVHLHLEIELIFRRERRDLQILELRHDPHRPDGRVPASNFPTQTPFRDQNREEPALWLHDRSAAGCSLSSLPRGCRCRAPPALFFFLAGLFFPALANRPAAGITIATIDKTQKATAPITGAPARKRQHGLLLTCANASANPLAESGSVRRTKRCAGFSCTSMKIPSQPAAIAARANTGASSPSPDVASPAPPGRCTECVASKMTRYPASRIQ